jgi:hypothetical protein
MSNNAVTKEARMTKSQRPNCAPYVSSPNPQPPAPNPSSAPPPNPENSQSVDQNLPPRWKRIFKFLDKCRSLLASQGSIVASWRNYRGQRLGPYYRLAYRKNGQQCSIYLGNCLGLVERVRDALEDIQGRMRESRVMSRLVQRAKEGLAACKERLRRQLATLGIHMKGYEMRGVREAAARDFRPIVSPLLDNPAIPPPPPMFVPPLRPYLRAWLWQAINEQAMANEAVLLARGEL